MRVKKTNAHIKNC